MKTRNRRTSDGIRILHKRFYAGRPDRLAALEEARAGDQVARELPGPSPEGRAYPNATCRAGWDDAFGHFAA